MPNGKPGDHPLTDIFIHGLDVYGKEIDDLIRKIGDLSSKRELDEWWEKEIGWNRNQSDLLSKVKQKHEQLLKRANESGWETEE
ncbi:MAG: hypothetical protein ACYSWO_04300 [Planctomycetota bacterium]|jgi:hypothetical protein